ncbi:lysophosphatidylserine lipase ABHD12-like isoform X1 [Cydia pomonella]|uniref:lysophosphatidylserine lipase ABHD12-like isoform X1 n=1 Tax=Cydia pomonella TaxID=82600 RepID=UPI002ADE297D|nr:lysophosphatidylserine lipase ABHD12-like isoform X1 [Cydia pomonella]
MKISNQFHPWRQVRLPNIGILNRLFLLGSALTAGLLVVHVAVVPLVFRYSKTFRRSLIFANFVQWPLHIDHEDPASSGIEGARNLSIEYQSKVDSCPIKIGIWHILPKSVYERLKQHFSEGCDKEQLHKLLDEELANSKTPIILYCHGNSNSRAASHRIQLYKFFQQMDFHTIAFDYRGYGDSTNIHPSENGVVEDSLMVYEWLRNTVDKGTRPSIFVWGHSLGTGISSHLLGNLPELSTVLLERPALPLPNGLILEAPFNNLADEVAHHPLSKLVTWLPYYQQTFVSQFVSRPEHCFRSDEHLARTRSLPVLILHARDDVIVPHVVGAKLYESIRQSRGEGDAPVTLHSYDKSENLGHKWICNAKDLPEVVGKFVETHRSSK